MSRPINSARFRYRLLLGVSLFATGCGGEGATGPTTGVTGVWRGHSPLGSPLDSILLILVDSTNGVSASAAWTLNGVERREMPGVGELAGAQLSLTLSGPPPSTGLELDLAFDGGTLTGTITDPSQGRQGPITLRRALPLSSALVGRWVLTAVRGITVAPGPEYTDTLILAADGRARRAVGRRSCGFVVGGAHDSRRGWLQLEFLTSPYLTQGECGYRTTHDSLQLRGSTLTRYTPLFGGATLEEDFARR